MFLKDLFLKGKAFHHLSPERPEPEVKGTFFKNKQYNPSYAISY